MSKKVEKNTHLNDTESVKQVKSRRMIYSLSKQMGKTLIKNMIISQSSKLEFRHLQT